MNLIHVLAMDIKDLARVDLNLLLALQVLLEERSVSRAAERLNITQPAMSKTLSRLRSTFDDPLFTRSSRSIQPTPRALDLAYDLQEVLGNVVRLLDVVEFDPAAFSGEFTIALSEYIGATLLPNLVQRLHEQAPQLSIRTITRVDNQLDQLANGQLDFAIHIRRGHYPADFTVEALGSSPPAILVREAHPLTQGEITWERLAAYPLISLYISELDKSEIAQTSNTYLRARDPEQAAFETSHLLTALEVIRSTDYFLRGPEFVTRNRAATEGIVALPLPAGSEYTMDYVMVRHARTANSPLHHWLWQEILSVIQGQSSRVRVPGLLST